MGRKNGIYIHYRGVSLYRSFSLVAHTGTTILINPATAGLYLITNTKEIKMRRNHNRQLSSELKLSSSIATPVKRDKGVDKDIKRSDNFSLVRIFKNVGKWLRNFFWKTPDAILAFQKPVREPFIVPYRVIQKRKALRQMQRDSRRANRGK